MRNLYSTISLYFISLHKYVEFYHSIYIYFQKSAFSSINTYFTTIFAFSIKSDSTHLKVKRLVNIQVLLFITIYQLYYIVYQIKYSLIEVSTIIYLFSIIDPRQVDFSTPLLFDLMSKLEF